MRIFRFMCGVTNNELQISKVSSERIRGMTKVCEVSKKVQESWLRWFGRVKRRGEECIGKRVMEIEEEGARRGRRRRWVHRIKGDLREKRLTGEEAASRVH